MKRVKKSIAVVIKNEQGQFLVVKRPEDEDSALAGAWGFPAMMLREGESEQDGVLRAGRTKLGITIRVGEKIGKRVADHGSYILHLSDYAATIPSNNMPKVPQPDTSMTQYVDLKYTDDPKVLLPAAQNGSLCSQVYLASVGIDWKTSVNASRIS